MCKNEKPVIGFRIPDDLLIRLDKWRENNGGVSRSMAIVYLLSQALKNEKE